MLDNIKISYFLFHPHGMFANGGGDVMLRNVEEWIAKKGFITQKYDIWSRNPDFDIFHLFASNGAVAEIYKPLKSLNKPLVVSAIDYSNMGKLRLKLYKFFQLYYPFPNIHKFRQELFDYAHTIIANSIPEKRFLLDYFDIDEKKIEVIPVGVSSQFYNNESNEFVDKYGLQNYILCVGRINPRKNQIKTIEALKKLGKDIVFIGLPDPSEQKYFKDFKKIVDLTKNVHWIGQLDFDSNMLSSAYRNASIHILPSNPPEFPGISSMEAGLSGTKVITTHIDALEDTFKDFAYYCEPTKESILNVTKKALNDEPSDHLKNHLKDFMWKELVNKYIDIYKNIIREESENV